LGKFVYMTGGITDFPVNFGGGALGGAGQAVFIAKFETTKGGHIWSKAFAGTQAVGLQIRVTDNVLDPNHIIVQGSFYPGISLNVGGLPMQSAGLTDIWLAKYDSNGNHIWSNRFGSLGADVPNDLTVDKFNNIISAGSVQIVNNKTTPPLSPPTAYLAGVDSNGNYLFDYEWNSLSAGVGVGGGPQGALYLVGNEQSQINFGGLPITPQGDGIFLVNFQESVVSLTTGVPPAATTLSSFSKGGNSQPSTPAQGTSSSKSSGNDKVAAAFVVVILILALAIGTGAFCYFKLKKRGNQSKFANASLELAEKEKEIKKNNNVVQLEEQ